MFSVSHGKTIAKTSTRSKQKIIMQLKFFTQFCATLLSSEVQLPSGQEQGSHEFRGRVEIVAAGVSRSHDTRRALAESGHRIASAQGSLVLAAARTSTFSRGCQNGGRSAAAPVAALLEALQVDNHFLDLCAFLAQG